MKITAIALAGGKSSRMGSDKALLEIKGETLLSRTSHIALLVADSVYIVARSQQQYQHLTTNHLKSIHLVVDKKFDGANGINSFTNWWQSVDQVTVDSMNIIELKDNSAVINISLTYKQGKKISSEILRISLLWNETSKQWQINETKRQ